MYHNNLTRDMMGRQKLSRCWPARPVLGASVARLQQLAWVGAMPALLAAAIGLGARPAPPPPAAFKLPPPVVVRLAAPAAKGDRLVPLVLPDLPAAMSPADRAAKPPVPELAAAPAARRELPPRDLCERHGRHKVWYDGGRRWRCRR
jgi:hypothetical protein